MSETGWTAEYWYVAPQFTPGPWRIKYDGGVPLLMGRDSCWPITDLYNRARPSASPADQALIATAPELYEALECLVYRNVAGDRARAHAALKKARGEQ